MKTWTTVVSLGVIAGFAASAVADHDHGNRHQRVFRAQLVGFNEVPSVSTPARGQFYAILNRDDTELTYWLSYSNLRANPTQSHIHFGQHHTNGAIVVWLCDSATNTGPSGTQVCPAASNTTASITGVLTAAQVVGPAAGVGQGIAANEFAAVVAALRAGAGYVNVHSSTFGGGEIRGQVN